MAWRVELQRMPEVLKAEISTEDPVLMEVHVVMKKYDGETCDVVETSQASECSFAKLLIGFNF